MVTMTKILGTSKITSNRKISLIKNVAEKLDAKEGDLIIFYDKYGEIVISKA